MQLSRAAAFVPVRLHIDEVDHAAHFVLAPDRDFGCDDVGAERVFERIERCEKVSALSVEHVDEDEAGEVEFGRSLPQT